MAFKFSNLYIYIYIYIYTTGHKWSTTHRVFKSHKSKMGVIYMQSWKQCTLLVITSGFVATHALGNMMYSYTLLVPMNQRVHNKQSKEHNTCWALFGSLLPAMFNCASCAQVHELPQSHCGDNWEGTLFSWLPVF